MIGPEVEDFPVLVVAYDEKSRAAIAASTAPFGMRAVPCASFAQAQDHALSKPCRGVLVDLATMIKAKEAEKIMAHTLTGIYPTLRVKSMGPILIPMIMSGDAKQDKSLKDFFTGSCAEYPARRLRLHKRKDLCIPAYLGAERGYTVNISWSGAFVVNMNPEQFSVGQDLTVSFLPTPGVDLVLQVTVMRIQDWGLRRPPGIGVHFKELDRDLEAKLAALLKSDHDTDRDRLPG